MKNAGTAIEVIPRSRVHPTLEPLAFLTQTVDSFQKAER